MDTEETVRDQISDFVRKFMPSVEPPEGQRLIPHSLLYDFNGRYSDVKFTVERLKECLLGYLDLIDPVIEAVTHRPDNYSATLSNAHYLYRLTHDDASELMLVYFGRTPRSAELAEFLSFAANLHAADRVKHLLEVIDPQGEDSGIDAAKRIYSVHSILKKLQKEYNELAGM